MRPLLTERLPFLDVEHLYKQCYSIYTFYFGKKNLPVSFKVLLYKVLHAITAPFSPATPPYLRLSGPEMSRIIKLPHFTLDWSQTLTSFHYTQVLLLLLSARRVEPGAGGRQVPLQPFQAARLCGRRLSDWQRRLHGNQGRWRLIPFGLFWCLISWLPPPPIPPKKIKIFVRPGRWIWNNTGS